MSQMTGAEAMVRMLQLHGVIAGLPFPYYNA